MQPATIRPLRKRMKVIKLRNRRPTTQLCNLSFRSAEKPVARKKPKKRVIEKLLPATPIAKAPEIRKFGSDFESELAEYLFSDIRDLFKSKKANQLRTITILDGLTKKFPWSIICNGKAINSRKLAEMLRPYGISSRDIKFADGGTFKAFKGYKLEWF